MHFGEFFGGLASYIYQNTFLKNKKKLEKNKNGINSRLIIYKKKEMSRVDGKFKIYLLIFFAAFFDFIEYAIMNFFVQKLAKLSPTSDIRLTSITTISSSLIFVYALKLRIGKHQFYSLLIIGICLFITLIVEFSIQRKVERFDNLLYAYLLTMISLIFITFTDTIEKYLTEFNFLNLVTIYSFGQNPFLEIKNVYDNDTTGNFILLIFLLFLYFVFSAGTNVYKLLSNVYYTPMAKSIAIYILNPILLIYSYFYENDFQIEGKSNIIYLIVNIILSIIIGFFGFVYNEFLVLFCCGLEFETHLVISKRSQFQFENAVQELKSIINDESFLDE